MTWIKKNFKKTFFFLNLLFLLLAPFSASLKASNKAANHLNLKPPYEASNELPSSGEPVQIFFSPKNASDPNSPYASWKKFVAAAQKNLFIASYNFDVIELAHLLVQKAQAGIKVEIIIDDQNYDLKKNQAAINILEAGNITIIKEKRTGLMHNKYIIRDLSSVLTGSLNFTHNGFFKNYNDIVIIHNSDLANEYFKNFTFLSAKHHIKKFAKFYNPRPKQIKLNESTLITPLFSKPNRDIFEYFKEEIERTKKNINFISFVFSSKEILTPMIKKLSRPSFAIRGIFDDDFESVNITKNWKNIPFQSLWRYGANVKYDRPYETMHHKLIIFDNDRLITGSFNFSNNAAKVNDENVLVIKSKKINAIYQKRFEQIWNKIKPKTNWEEFIIQKNKQQKQGRKLTYKEFLDRKNRDRFKAIPRERESFSGKVIEAQSGEKILVEMDKSKLVLRVNLSGIESAQEGVTFYNQEPQFRMAKEKLMLLLAQKNISGIVTHEQGGTISALVYLPKGIGGSKGSGRNGNKESTKRNAKKEPRETINAVMLESGLAFLKNEDREGTLKLKIGKQAWGEMEKKSQQAQRLKKGFWREELALKETPAQFKDNLEKMLLNLVLQEKQYSEAKYTYGYLIGNKKTKVAYQLGNRNHYRYQKDLEDEKLIFFKNTANAERAGYTIRK